MRALFVCLPGVGHVRPMLPLARAMRDAGHEIRFATGNDFHPLVASAGFRCETAGPTRAEAMAERLRRHPDSVSIHPTEQQRFHVRKVWGRIYAPAMLDDLRSLTKRWSPDLVVHDAMAFAGPLLGASTGIPTVSHSTGPGFAFDLLEQAAEEVAPLWQELGMSVPPGAGIYRSIHLDVWPSMLQLDDLGDRGDVHPIATSDDEPSGDDRMPGWFAAMPERTTVHLTLGTVFNGNTAAFRTVVEALRDEAINLIVTVGPNRDPGDLGPQPSNVYVERWLPHGPVLDTCDLVITHGGAGTTLKSLERRLPLLLLPQGADMFRTARACGGLGVARFLAPDDVSVDAVREALRVLRDDPSYRARCESISNEIAQLTPPPKLVPVLEEFAGR